MATKRKPNPEIKRIAAAAVRFGEELKAEKQANPGARPMPGQHTPTPWYFGRMAGYGSVCILRRPESEYGPIGTVGDAPVAILVDRAPHWESMYPVAENAAHIVRCVNAHDKLLAACKAARDFLEPLNLEFSVNIIKQLEESIAAADGTG